MKLTYFFVILLFPCLACAKYSHESEVSSVTTGGNTDVETYLFRTVNKLEFDNTIYRLSGHYTYGEASGVVSARDWDINISFEHKIRRNMSWFIGEVAEGLPFQGIRARYNSDIGLKYYYIKLDERNFFSELGYRYTVEDQVQPGEDQYEHKGRFFTEYNDKPTKNFSYRLWIEYIPSFTKGDYLFIHEASITSILSSIFSLKLAFRGNYDQKPVSPGLKNYDYSYTSSLLARF